MNKKYENILTKEALEKAYAELKTLTAVSNFFKISITTIVRYMRRFDIMFKTCKRPIIYTCDNNFFSEQNAQSNYWAGFIAADGCITAYNMVSIDLASKDEEHLYKLKQQIKCAAPISKSINKVFFKNIKKQKEYYKSILNFCSNNIVKDLQKIYGITPRKTYTYKIPDDVLNSPFARDFIRGYFDGDGWFNKEFDKKSNKYRLHWGICGNYQTISQIRKIINENCKFSEDSGYLRLRNKKIKYYRINIYRIKIRFY